MDIERYTEAFDPNLAQELERSQELARLGYFTEAAVRLGRAIEAALYEAARELSVDLTNRVIDELDAVQAELRNRQVNLLRKKSSLAVRELAHASKRLAESIARLTEDETLRDGRLDSRPRTNEQLLRDLIARTEDPSLKRRLEESKDLLRRIQEMRNCAAHASITGDLIELSNEDYESMRTLASDFLEHIFDVLLGARADRFWSVSAS